MFRMPYVILICLYGVCLLHEVSYRVVSYRIFHINVLETRILYITTQRRQGIETFSAMMTSSNGNLFPRNWPFVRGIHRGSPHNGQWRGALMFSLICVWIRVNNHEAGDFRRYRAHHDVIVMALLILFAGNQSVIYLNYPIPLTAVCFLWKRILLLHSTNTFQ